MNNMKKSNILVTALLLMAFTLLSCDGNKGKVEEAAKQFISAVNNHDKATIYSLYPNAKNIENMTLPDSIQKGDISVEKNDSGDYVVNIKNDRQQALVFKVADDKNISLLETFSVLQLDSAAMELAIKTGVPMKQLSDLKLSELFNEDGDFIAALKEKYASYIGGQLIYESGTYCASRNFGGSVTVTQPIRNVGTVPIKADEYNVEFNFYCPNGTAASSKEIVSGVDLQPGEGYTYNVFPSGYVNAAYEHDFRWTISFVYKNISPIQSLLKFAKMQGDEYDEFMKKNDPTQLDPGVKKMEGHYELKGTIGEYDVSYMKLDISKGNTTGSYHYSFQKEGVELSLSGEYEKDGTLTLNETTPSGTKSGRFEGKFDGKEFSGTFHNLTKGTTFPFSLRLI